MSNLESKQIVDIMCQGGVVPVVRLPNAKGAVDMARALLKGGITAVELTMTSPGAVDAVEQIRKAVPAFDEGRAVIGMGSVTNAQQAWSAIEVGAQFVVSPITDMDTIAFCLDNDVPIMPGALTPSEIQAAWVAGASVVKVFPARAFGPIYFKDILAPLPHLRLMPTGGVSLDNAGDFIRNGAVAIGAGSNLVNKQWVAQKEWSKLTAQAAAYVKVVREARRG